MILQEWSLVVLVLILKFFNPACAYCDYVFKLNHGQRLRLNGHGFSSSCRWTIFSDSGVKFTCQRDAKLITPNAWGRNYNFAIYVDGTSKKEYYLYNGQGSRQYKSRSNVMIVELNSQYSIPEGTFDCVFEPTEEYYCGMKNQDRYISQTVIGENEYPMVAAIVQKYPLSFPISRNDILCTGTIISSQYILTTASCLNGRNPYYLGVLTGAHNVENRQDKKMLLHTVNETRIHEYYNHQLRQHDIGLVRLNTFIEFSYTARPACLPYYRSLIRTPVTVGIFGWRTSGNIRNPVLQKATFQLQNREFCAARTVPRIDSTQMMCTLSQNSDTCNFGDGGPILWRDPRDAHPKYFVLGVNIGSKNCGNLGYSMRVNSYIKWIENHSRGAFFAVIPDTQ